MLKKKNFKKLIALSLVFSITATSVPVFANKDTALKDSITVSKEILWENEWEDIQIPTLDYNLMTAEERELFYEAVEYEVARLAREARLRNTVEFNEAEHKEQLIRFMTTGELPESRLFGIGIRNSIVGSAINVAISIVVEGPGVAALQTYIRNVGRDAARRVFTKTVISELTRIGAPTTATVVGIIVNFILDYTNVGLRIAEHLDSIDSRPNNGYVNF